MSPEANYFPLSLFLLDKGTILLREECGEKIRTEEESLPQACPPLLWRGCVFGSTPKALGTKALGVQAKTGEKLIPSL
jgi:hypothetical protein